MLREGEVAAVIGVEHIGNPTNMPARIVLAPDRLAQSERRLCGRWRLEKQEIARDSTAVVIQNYSKPWLGRIFTFPLHQNIKEGVIRLPNCIGSLCLPAVNQVECGAVGLLSFMRQSQEPCGYLPHHLIDDVIARCQVPCILGDLTNPTVYRSPGGGRIRQPS